MLLLDSRFRGSDVTFELSKSAMQNDWDCGDHKASGKSRESTGPHRFRLFHVARRNRCQSHYKCILVETNNRPTTRYECVALGYYLRSSDQLDHRAFIQPESFCEWHTMSITDRLAHDRLQEKVPANRCTALPDDKLLLIVPGALAVRLRTAI